MNSVTPVLFEGTSSYRRIPVLLMGAIAGAMAIMALWILVRFCFADNLMEGLIAGEVVVWINCLFFFVWFLGFGIPSGIVASTLLSKYLLNERDQIRIDASGTTIGRDHISWSNVEWIGGKRRVLSDRIDLVIRNTSSMGMPRRVVLDSPWSDEEFTDVMLRIENTIERKFPRVDVGVLLGRASKVSGV